MKPEGKLDKELRRAATAARRSNERMRLFGPDGRILPRKEAVSHYHLAYNDIVHWSVVFETQTLAFKEMHRLGQESEPNTQWYEEGPVMIETSLPGRTGLHRILLQAVACHHASCIAKAKEVHRVPTIEEIPQ
jgi:hypothetical protein